MVEERYHITLWQYFVISRQCVPLWIKKTCRQSKSWQCSSSCVDLHWHLPRAQDTGRESGIFAQGREVTVVIERNIMEGPATTGLHTSAPDSIAVRLSATAIAPPLTVCSLPRLFTDVRSHTSVVFGRFFSSHVNRTLVWSFNKKANLQPGKTSAIYTNVWIAMNRPKNLPRRPRASHCSIPPTSTSAGPTSREEAGNQEYWRYPQTARQIISSWKGTCYCCNVSQFNNITFFCCIILGAHKCESF